MFPSLLFHTRHDPYFSILSVIQQHAMMLPVLTHHIRYHQCLMHLDKLIGYVFKDRCLLQVRPSDTLVHTHQKLHYLNTGIVGNLVGPIHWLVIGMVHLELSVPFLEGKK